MEYRQLGRCGLRVSTLTMGTMTFGGSGEFATSAPPTWKAPAARSTMALDAGVNLIDTADIYSRAPRRRSSDRRCAAAATRCCWRPRRGSRWATAPTTPACRATT